MIRINPMVGVRMSFENGWTVNVQQSSHHYSNTNTAEVGYWRGNCQTRVEGWQSGEEVAQIIARVSGYDRMDDVCHCGESMQKLDHCPHCGCEEHEPTACSENYA